MAFSINKCCGLKLNLNAPIWLLDTLEKLAEQKYYEELKIAEEPNSDAVTTKPVSDKYKDTLATVKRTLLDYFEKIKNKTISTDRNDRHYKTTVDNTDILSSTLTQVGNNTGNNTCSSNINHCTKKTSTENEKSTRNPSLQL